MKLQTGRLTHLRRRARERGYFYNEVTPAIVSIDTAAGSVTVDMDSPAYPRLMSLPKMPGQTLWDMIHHRPLVYVHNPASNREVRYLIAAGHAVAGSCDCWFHWQQYLAAHPPRIRTPAEYALWTYDAHVAVNLRIGKPGITRAAAIDRYRWASLFAA